MIRKFVLMFWMITIVACKSGQENGDNFHQIPTVKSVAIEKYPLRPLVDEIMTRQISQFTKLPQLFFPEKIIRLEVSEESIIGSIYGAVYFKDSWIVLDKIQRCVLRFSKNGEYMCSIGRIGSGPDEYTQPNTVAPCFDNNLAVYDSAQGRLIVYDEQGEFLFATNLQENKVPIFPRSSFIWEEKEHLYLLGFPSANPVAPWHVLVNPYSAASNSQVIIGFGERFEPYRQRGMPPWDFISFAVVGDKIWTGSPYSNKIDIFDFEGRFYGQIGRRGSPNEPKKEDHDVRKNQDVISLRNEKDFNIKMCAVGPVVVSWLNHYVDIYDHYGNLLTPPLKAENITYPLTSFTENGQHFLVTPFFVKDKKSDYTQEVQELMTKAGYRLDSLGDENMGLLVSRLNL